MDLKDGFELDTIVLRALQEPKTAKELATILGVHYMTARNYLKPLVETNRVKALPIRQGREIRYIALAAGTKESQGKIVYMSRATPISAIMAGWYQSTSVPNASKALFALWWNHYAREKKLPETSVEDFAIAKDLIFYRAALKDMVEAIDQLLAAPIWEKDFHTVAQFADSVLPEIHERAVEYEHDWQQNHNRRENYPPAG